MKATQSLCPREPHHRQFQDQGSNTGQLHQIGGPNVLRMYAGKMCDQVIFEAADDEKLER